jgi:hypothetical protein
MLAGKQRNVNLGGNEQTAEVDACVCTMTRTHVAGGSMWGHVGVIRVGMKSYISRRLSSF